MRQFFFISLVIAVLAATVLFGADDSKGLQRLEGKWIGTGWAELPFMSVSVDVEGTAEFRFDSLCQCFITRLKSSRLLMPYSDSGQMSHDSVTDSLFWKIKDNFGRHTEVAAYISAPNSDRLIVIEKTGRKIDSTIMEFKNDDSLIIIWKQTDKKGRNKEKGRVNLTRSK